MITLNPHKIIQELLYGKSLPEIRALKDCEQDLIHHQEGDVYTHTKLVCEKLNELPDYQKIPANKQAILLTAALFHDIAKPYTITYNNDDSISYPHHSFKGSRITRKILYKLGVNFSTRELICHLIRWHMKPFHSLYDDNPIQYITEISLSTRADWLAILAKADTLGSKPVNKEMLLLVDLFIEQAQELDCLEKSFKFNSDHARYVYFNKTGWTADNDAYDDTRCTVIIMSGLPGAGKNYWIDHHLPGIPQISLDALRRNLKIKPTDDQAPVIRTAKNKARDFLRAKQNFIWNATNLSLIQRNQCIRLFKEYAARLHIVYVETDHENLKKQNKTRFNPVPENVIDGLMNNWDLPLPTEAHKVEYIVNDEIISFPEILVCLT